MRRAQAALEFITTYGWALVVILLAIGALTYFGIFDSFIKSPDKCELWPEFFCEESQVSQDGSVHLVIRNNLPDLEMVNVTLNTQSCTLIEDTYSQTNIKNTEILNGSLITFSCTQPLISGELFIADILVNYRGSDQAIFQQVKGYIRRAIE